ncbi:ACT domain-containing protein [Euzebya sp.]|uniref:ACT domain-containing protein n=1 Tax=Euzebya sp. TaxID=1971409 RepID=UPI0035169BC9
MRFALRLSLPDRRGALSAVASAIGRAGGNIVSLDVIDSVDGMAVDDVTVEADADADALRRAIEEVPSVVVEAIMRTSDFRDPTAPLELATTMVETGSGAVKLLVDGLPHALWSSWALVVAGTHLGPEIIHTAGEVPPVEGLETPWMPLDQLRRLPRAPWMPETWRAHTELELVAAPLAQRSTVVLLARERGPRFLDSEVAQLGRLARVAVRAEVLAAQNGRRY